MEFDASTPPTVRDAASLPEADVRGRLQRAMVFIEENLGSVITVEDAARVACFTPRHFQRVFQGFTGETVRDHLRRLRAERAAVYIRHFGMSVTAASLAVGFGNSSGLFKAMKQRYGCAPNDLRAPEPECPGPLPPLAVRSMEMPRLRFAFMRHIGDPKKSLSTWVRLLTWARRERLLRDDTVLAGIAHDSSDTAIEAQRYDAAVSVPPNFTPSSASGAAIREIPAGPVLQHRFSGTLLALEARWELFSETWFPRSGRQLRDGVTFDLFPPVMATWRKLAALLVNPGATVHSTLCIPVLY